LLLSGRCDIPGIIGRYSFPLNAVDLSERAQSCLLTVIRAAQG
jgi:hypothetical protein